MRPRIIENLINTICDRRNSIIFLRAMLDEPEKASNIFYLFFSLGLSVLIYAIYQGYTFKKGLFSIFLNLTQIQCITHHHTESL